MYFSNIASSIGFNDGILNAETAINTHKNHPSISKIRQIHCDRRDSFDFNLVNDSYVETKLKKINPRKATGYDTIPGKLIRLAHSELASPICRVLNCCIATRTFPGVMKLAELSPVFKKNDNLTKGNYRPVSVLSCISKVYESILNDQLVAYFCDMFNKLVSAFRKGYSCQSLLIRLIDDWKNALDNNNIIGAVFMDLSKAFDCLSHSLLIAKLNAYGMTYSSCCLLSDYLTDRKQRVKLGSSRSTWNDITKGVPQGSILGPLLFNVFMNDLFFFIERCSLYNYADDNSLSAVSKDISEVIGSLKHDCQVSIDWFENNGMQANPDKFHFMLLSSKVLHVDKLDIGNGTIICSEPYIKALGVVIDHKLNFSEHVSASCKKAARQLNALARISRFLDVHSRKIIYNSFICSNFNYCPLVWTFCGKMNNKKIERIQERALRILYRDYTSELSQLFEKSGEDTVLISRLKCLSIEMFKATHGMSPQCLQELFQIKDTPYSLRAPLILEQPKRRCTIHMACAQYLIWDPDYGMIYLVISRAVIIWMILKHV